MPETDRLRKVDRKLTLSKQKNHFEKFSKGSANCAFLGIIKKKRCFVNTPVYHADTA